MLHIATWRNPNDYDPNAGVLTMRNVLDTSEGGLSTNITSSTSSDGNMTQSLSLNQTVNDQLSTSLTLSEAAMRLGASDSYQLSTEQKAALGVNFSSSDLDATLNLSSSSSGSHSASFSVDKQFGNGFEAGGDAETTWGTS